MINKIAFTTSVIATLLVGCNASAAPATSITEKDTVLNLSDVQMENISIKGRIQTWSMTKVCINGQAYLLLDGVTGPNGIAPSYKDGRPEACTMTTPQAKK
mgnify:CR=1 FL=1